MTIIIKQRVCFQGSCSFLSLIGLCVFIGLCSTENGAHRQTKNASTMTEDLYLDLQRNNHNYTTMTDHAQLLYPDLPRNNHNYSTMTDHAKHLYQDLPRNNHNYSTMTEYADERIRHITPLWNKNDLIAIFANNLEFISCVSVLFISSLCFKKPKITRRIVGKTCDYIGLSTVFIVPVFKIIFLTSEQFKVKNFSIEIWFVVFYLFTIHSTIQGNIHIYYWCQIYSDTLFE